jgi:sec-independent protein translocase protein TatA
MGLENPIHLMIVLLVALMVFGAKRLPDMGRSLGEGMRGFKESISGQTPEVATLAHTEPVAAPQMATVPTRDEQHV